MNIALKKLKILYLIVFFFGPLCIVVMAQNQLESQGQKIEEIPYYPEVGKPCPDAALTDIRYFNKKKARIKDFRGKWLILDFWNRTCGACIASFPHMSELQKELGDKVQVMMVAIQDPDKQVDQIYSKYRAKQKLLMPCDFDSALANRFDILTTPYSILIDDKGFVRAITTTIHTKEMKAFLAGENPTLTKVYRMHEDEPNTESVNKVTAFDPARPLMINGNGAADTNFLYRSVLSAWAPNTRFRPIVSVEAGMRELGGKGFQALGVRLTDLFFYAYLGLSGPSDRVAFHDKPVLEVKDTTLFAAETKNRFCYALNLASKTDIGRVLEIMQGELKNYFGYEASIETRRLPCLKLVAQPGAAEKLKTHGGERSMEGVLKVGYTGRNIPFTEVVRFLRIMLGSEAPIIDETGISGNVDIRMDCEACILTDLEDTKRALQANGLELVASEKEMKVLVIRDNKVGNTTANAQSHP